ncbi:hypothetical protein N7474_001930 [Penicillium riverlandense]|uniref:uncharacterized protein n=1 Tax=Penicillium riverlandense TaxID=1903569 RepID=UPI002548DA39|nr:uncharacterized protein N7474_001930 [Penicillium riverlandense]KAJ5833619.1 hypothetical protein N7474_001930 [Penicillium riverlandense]
MSSLTFVFALGAWVTPKVFGPLRARLDALGVSSECPPHPSIGAEPPSKTLADDVASLRDVLTTLVDEGKDVVVVAHSYGGVVASAAVEGLDKIARGAANKPGGVSKVVFLSAFALDKGQSLLGMLGGNFLPWMRVEGDYVYADAAGAVGWQDLPPGEQEQWNAAMVHTSRSVFSGEATYEPWHEIPCAYIICEQDHALPPPFQEQFASKVGGPEDTYRLPSSHSPFLSMPDKVAALLQDIVSA